MARPTKQGLDYFPLDVDIMSDVKMRRLIKDYGAAAISVVISILCIIYKDEGYYLRWSDDMPFLISEETGVSEDEVTDVLGKAISIDFFDRKLYENEKIVTSKGVQKRFFKAVERRRNVSYISDYLLIDEVQLNLVSVDTNQVNDNNNLVNDNNNRVNVDKSTQSKGKVNTKVNKKEKLVGEPGPTNDSPSGISPYGKFKNVELSENEYEDIKATYDKPLVLIDKVSGIIANLKTKRDNHHAYVYTIAENDHWPRKAKSKPLPKKVELTSEEQEAADLAREKAMEKVNAVCGKQDSGKDRL